MSSNLPPTLTSPSGRDITRAVAITWVEHGERKVVMQVAGEIELARQRAAHLRAGGTGKACAHCRFWVDGKCYLGEPEVCETGIRTQRRGGGNHQQCPAPMPYLSKAIKEGVLYEDGRRIVVCPRCGEKGMLRSMGTKRCGVWHGKSSENRYHSFYWHSPAGEWARKVMYDGV
ncbi:MAG: hypothetical protein ACXQS4_02545 [Methermicoccaceae archaeon]